MSESGGYVDTVRGGMGKECGVSSVIFPRHRVQVSVVVVIVSTATKRKLKKMSCSLTWTLLPCVSPKLTGP